MYQINVDHEIPNVAGGQPNCRSPLHAQIGPHYEITIHSFPSECRKGGGTNRPPTRSWDDSGGRGYVFADVVAQAQTIVAREPGLKVRRCRRCNVPPHLPEWD